MPRKIKDLTGQRFERLIVISPIKKNGRTYWHCKCDCGNEKDIVGYNLTSGKTKSCGCLSAEKARERLIKDISGQRFGRLIAIKRTGNMIRTNSEWECKCDCGKTTYVSINDLTQGKVQSCGCLQKESRYSSFEDKQLNKINKNNLIGKKFGKLLVIKDSGIRKNNHVYWTCECDCGNIINVSATHLIQENTMSCGCMGRSKGEFLIEQILRKNDINYEIQYTFNDCKDKNVLRFDFYLPDYNCCIEYDGEQHFINRTSGYFQNTLADIQKRDNIKNQYCKNNNIKLIRIPYTHTDICINDLLPQFSIFII